METQRMSLILKLLFYLHQGTVQGLFIVSLLASPFVFLLEKFTKWNMENETYVLYVLGAIVADHILGTLYHTAYKKDFSFGENLLGLLKKTVIVIAMAYLFEGINDLMPQVSFIKDYTITMLRMLVFLYPAGSALGNSYIMTGGVFPPKIIMDKLKKYQDGNTTTTHN